MNASRARVPFVGVTTARVRDLPRVTAAAWLMLGPAAWSLTHLATRHTHQRLRRAERLWARTAFRLLATRVDAHGLEHVDPSEQYVVVALHEGVADVPLLLHLPLPLTFVARSELLGWRVLGPHLRRARHIVVEPERPIVAYREILREAGEVFARGDSLAVFPQGTLLGVEAAFQPAAFRIADRLGRRVLPVVIAGTHRLWGRPFRDRLEPGTRVSLTVLPPIPVGQAESSLRRIERAMKRRALVSGAPSRRYEPRRDGWWDGYRFSIDPDFAEVAAQVERHRSSDRAGAVPA